MAEGILVNHRGKNIIKRGWNWWSKKPQTVIIDPTSATNWHHQLISVRENERIKKDFFFWTPCNSVKKMLQRSSTQCVAWVTLDAINTSCIKRDNELRGYIVIWGISHCTAVAMQLPVICSALFSSIFPLGEWGDWSYTALLWQQALITGSSRVPPAIRHLIQCHIPTLPAAVLQHKAIGQY